MTNYMVNKKKKLYVFVCLRLLVWYYFPNIKIHWGGDLFFFFAHRHTRSKNNKNYCMKRGQYPLHMNVKWDDRTFWPARRHFIISFLYFCLPLSLSKYFSSSTTMSQQRVRYLEPRRNRKRVCPPQRAPVNLQAHLSLYGHSDVKGQASVVVSRGLCGFTPAMYFLSESRIAVLSLRLTAIIEVTSSCVCSEGWLRDKRPGLLGGLAVNIAVVLEVDDVLCREGIHLCLCVFCGKEHQWWSR